MPFPSSQEACLYWEVGDKHFKQVLKRGSLAGGSEGSPQPSIEEGEGIRNTLQERESLRRCRGLCSTEGRPGSSMTPPALREDRDFVGGSVKAGGWGWRTEPPECTEHLGVHPEHRGAVVIEAFVCLLTWFCVVYRLIRFEEYNLVALSPSQGWAIVTPNHLQNIFITLNRNSVLIKQYRPFPPSPQPLVTSILCAISVNLPILGTSYEWNHTSFVLWPLVYLTWHSVFQIHP